MQAIAGTVVPGKQQARELGYPTANLKYASETSPEHGVWACRARVQDQIYNALAVVGMWSLENLLPSLEVHILDFNQDLYDQELSVELITKLRDLLPFSDMDSLKQQIVEDIRMANESFT
jgi:riboflavin kinase/FMN adenylyltransferase